MTGIREAVESLRSARRYDGVPNAELRKLIEKWREKASRHGSVPYGSYTKAAVYSECADDLEELIDS